MRLRPCWAILCLWLLLPLTAHAEPEPDLPPYHYAVVIPAKAIEGYGDSLEAYDGVEFPLFCGFASVYPRENRFVFTKTVDLPLLWVEKVLGDIEEKGGLPDPNLAMPANDSRFGTFFSSWVSNYGFEVFYISQLDDEIPLDMAPKFTRTCPYDSKKQPPVECGYRKEDIDKLRIPYAREIEVRKELELERQAGQKQ